VINPAFTTAVTVKRPTEDAFGNKSFTVTTVDAVVALSAGGKQSWRAHGERYIQGGSLFVPRGSDVMSGDQIVYGGNVYSVVGAVRGDQDHPFTGDDFGWVVFGLEGGG
jgi:hypothetical protein